MENTIWSNSSTLSDAYLSFQVEKSRLFRREGADIHSDVTISLSQAVLGGSIRIPGIYENILLNVSTVMYKLFQAFFLISFIQVYLCGFVFQIPQGTSSHTRIRLPGKGIARTHSYGHGDHYVHVKIKIPV